mgnify:CR=1 FL=1
MLNRNVWLLSLCQALLNTGNILLVSVNALIGQQLASDPALITLPVALQFIGLMAATIPASLLMKKIGRKRGFYLGNSIGVVGSLVCVAALYDGSFAIFCLGTAMLGVAIGFGTLYRFAAVEATPPEQHSRAISLVMAGGVLAAILGPNLAIYSREWVSVNSFIGPFLGLTVLYVLALVILTGIKISNSDTAAADGPARPLSEILLQPVFIVAVVSAMVGYGVMVLLMTATPLAMIRCGFDFRAAAGVIEWHVLGMFVPAFFTGRLIQRFGTVALMQVGALLMVACAVINMTGVSKTHFWTALVLLGVGWCFMFVSATQHVTKAYRPAEKAKAQAANEFLVFSLSSVAALAAGWMEASLGWFTMNWVMLPLLAWAMIMIWLFNRKHVAIAATA